MLWAGLAAFTLALVTYFVFEPSLDAFDKRSRAFGVIALFSLVCLSEPLN